MNHIEHQNIETPFSSVFSHLNAQPAFQQMPDPADDEKVYMNTKYNDGEPHTDSFN